MGLFRVASNPVAIRRGRNRTIARTLELLLFRHDLRVSLSACRRILGANVVYLGQFGRPFLVSVVPLCLIYVQMAEWFEHRPLRVGETATVEMGLCVEKRRISLADSRSQIRMVRSDPHETACWPPGTTATKKT